MLGILVASMLLPKVFLSRLRYGLWVVVLLGLAIPLRPFIGDGLITIGLPANLMAYEQIQFVPGFTAEPQITGSMGDTVQGRSSPIPVEYAHTISAGSIPFFEILALIWIAVAIVVFTNHIWKYIHFIQIVKRWSIAIKDEAVLSVFQNVQEEKGIKRNKIGLRRCNFVSTSMLVGFLRPMVLLPDKDFNDEELDLIFRHEFIHYKRGDLYTKLLSIIALSLHWFNPMLYLMSSAMQADCEASCDEAVLADVGRQNKQFYAELIMDMIGDKNRKGTLLSTCFYGSKRGIKIRMEAIMNGAGAVGKLTFSTLLAVFLTLTVLSGSVFAFSSQPAYSPATVFQALPQGVDENGLLSAVQARDTALAAVGGGTFLGLFYDNYLDIYRIEILHGDTRYYLAINAATGDVMIYRSEAVLDDVITWGQAAEIAISLVGGGNVSSGAMEIIGNETVFMFQVTNEYRLYEIMIGGSGEVLLLNHMILKISGINTH